MLFDRKVNNLNIMIVNFLIIIYLSTGSKLKLNIIFQCKVIMNALLAYCKFLGI